MASAAATPTGRTTRATPTMRRSRRAVMQLILDIFNKTGSRRMSSRLCFGAYCRYATTWPWTWWYSLSRLWPACHARGRWSQALNESLRANEPSAVAPGVRERRGSGSSPTGSTRGVARTVRVLSAPRPGRPHTCTSARMARQPASGAARRSRCCNADGEHLPTHAGAASGFRRDAWCTPTFHVNRVELSFTHQCG